MSNIFTVTSDEILHQLKLSCQIPSTVEEILSRKITAHVAQKVGIQVEREELQQAADRLRLSTGLHTTKATQQWLQQNRLSLDDFEDLIRTTVLPSKLAEHLFADKVEAFFTEHQLDYAQAILYEVVLNDKNFAMKLFYAIQEGEMSYYEAAHQHIQGTELGRIGSYRGALRRTDLKAEISAAVFAATPPQVLKPITTSVGVHLILVEELIQPQLDNILRQTILSDLFSDWLKKQIEQSEVVIDFDSKQNQSREKGLRARIKVAAPKSHKAAINQPISTFEPYSVAIPTAFAKFI